ncbi:MAG: VWA domain-containing protein [Candidatus Krumholzibacteriia bacterium]
MDNAIVPRRHLPALLAAAAVMLLTSLPGAAQNAWTFADTQPATNPLPWACGSDPGAQLKVHEHQNWHCSNPSVATPAWGAAFIGFHKQFILDFEAWRLPLGGDRVEIWDYGPGAVIPGDNETTATPFTHCPEFDGSFDPGTYRPAGSVCNGCMALPNSLNVMNIGSYPTLGDAGAALQSSGWHGSFHLAAGAAGGACNEVASTATAIRDPVFFMGHKKVDDIARTWQRQKAADIVVVIDRSGSMNDDCDNNVNCSGPNPPGDEACRLNAAKNAALIIADLLDDAGVDGDQHRIGLVSYAGTATVEVGLTNASSVVTNNGVDDTAYELAIAGIEACGATSIGAGIDAALTMLAGGSNPHQALLILTDGLENTAPFIDDVAAMVGADIQVCAIGIGTGGDETSLRNLTENHAGAFIAQDDLDTTALTLEKFFVDCFAQIFDEVINEDPELILPAGEVASLPITLEVLPMAPKLMIATGHRDAVIPGAPAGLCGLDLLVTTPSGDLVDLADPQVEMGDGRAWDFTRVRLPYRGEQAGTWHARLVRPQRLFVHGFATDAYQDPARGIALVRDEIHRLCPRGAGSVLYYEDGNLAGWSSYRDALDQEQTAGLLGDVVQTGDPTEFLDQLLGRTWDLIVFARQLYPTPQVFDQRLATVLCNPGQKALVTDLYPGFAAANPIYACLSIGVEPTGYERVIGDDRLVSAAEPVALDPSNYQLPYLTLNPGPANQPLLAQAWTEFQQPCIVGSGSVCNDQDYFYTTHTAGYGRVEAANIRPRVLVGQPILATFMMTELNRPPGGWDAVQARVDLYRPGGGGQPTAETYQLYDDGTNGDKNVGNNTWSNLIPAVATQPGPHRLRAVFDLTLGGQTVRREAQYSVIVEPEPDPGDCLRIHCNESVDVAAGWQTQLVACLGNLCLEPDTYDITMQDGEGWLCVRLDDGTFESVGQYQYTSGAIPGGEPTCLDDEMNVFVCVPPGATTGQTTELTLVVRPQNNPAAVRRCVTVYRVVNPGLTPVDPPHTPSRFALHAAFPNPFNPSTEISFELPGDAGQQHVTVLQIFDVRGTLVRTLVDGVRGPGRHTVAWDGRDETGRRASAGVYVYVLEAAGQRASEKMVMLK